MRKYWVAVLVGFVFTGMVSCVAKSNDSQDVGSSSSSGSVDQWMLLVAIIAGLVGVFTTTVMSWGAARTLGRIEGEVHGFQERLDDHSDTLKDHQEVILMLARMPSTLKQIATQISDLYDLVKIVNKGEPGGS